MARFVPKGASLAIFVCLGAAMVTPPVRGGEDLGPLPRARLYAVHPAGGGVGTSFDVEITAGEDLEGVSALVFTHAQITAKMKIAEPKPTWPVAQRMEKQFKVEIGRDVPTGVYEVRVLGIHGLSNARAFVVGAGPELSEKSPNQTSDQAQELPLGTVMNAVVEASKFDYFKFTATKGQRLLIECFAERIDSNIDATLTLFDGSGREIARDHDTKGLDPLLDLSVPEDGSYVIRVHDFLYEGGPHYFYRLRVSSEPHVDFVFPPAGEPGTAQYTVYGRNLPNSIPAEHLLVHGRPLEQATIELEIPERSAANKILVEQRVRPFESMFDQVRLPVVASQAALPFYYATAPVVVEQEPNDDSDQAQKVAPPCEIAGQFHPSQDVDYFEFDAKKDDVYFVDVFSHRLGLPTDPYMLIQQLPKPKESKESKEGEKDAEGEEVEEGPKDLHELDDLERPKKGGISEFDIYSRDPSHRFVVPADGTYRLLVRDLNASGRGDLLYRLAIRPAQPDFRLVTYRHGYKLSEEKKRIGTSPWPMVLRRGAAEQIGVVAFRRGGFDGDIDIEVDSLPPGVAASKTTIYSGHKTAPLLLRASEDAEEWSGTIKVIGRARLGDREVVRESRSAEVQLGSRRNRSGTQVRLTGETTLAVDADWQFPFTIECEDQNVAMSRAGKIEIPIKYSRQESFEKDVSLSFEKLPEHVSVNSITFKTDKDEAQLQLQIKPEANPSQHPMLLMANTEVKMVRHPGALAAAREAEQLIDKVHGELVAAASAAAEAQSQAEEKLSAFGEPETETDPTNDDPAYRSAAEAMAQAKLAAEQAQERVKKAEEAQAEAVKRIRAAKNGEEQPERCRITIPVALINLDIRPAPVELKLTASSEKLAPGEKVEITATINRLFGFKGETKLELIAQEALVGVSLEGGTITIAKAKEKAKLVVLTTDQTPAGSHELRFKARVRFEDKDLEFEEPLKIEVTAPPESSDND